MILNGKVINPGELRTEITLQKRSPTTGAGGFIQPGWTDIATVWSRWINAHGSEIWAAQAVQAQAPATVLIRYRSDVDTTCVVLNGSIRYEIVSVDDIQARGEYLELKVRRLAPG